MKLLKNIQALQKKAGKEKQKLVWGDKEENNTHL